MRRTLLAAIVLTCWPAGADAATGVCDANPPTSTDACIAAIQNGGTVVNDIFRDANGLTGQQLPLFGTLFNAWPGCTATSWAGCAGQSQAPFDCPGQYVCLPGVNDFATASTHANLLDRLWWHPCRLSDHTLDASGCPKFQTACIADGLGGGYLPWEGLVFDMGGQANKVAIFAENDHGPQPCESTEYTVYLSDNPLSRELVQDPLATGVDPQKWNRAVLSVIFTKGWVEVRPPDPVGRAACGDTADYAVEEDSFVTVYALPCGVTFRYAAIVAGNDGLDFPECAFDSNEGEIDAVAGLTESGAAVCPDADGDLYADCACVGAPPVCDCNDADPTVHPGAPEACDSADKNCDGAPGACEAGLFCYQSLCLEDCPGEVSFCPAGATCSPTPQGMLCVPQDCTVGGCPPGGVCVGGICVPACTDVVCPSGQECLDGACLDPCATIQCPSGQLCEGGACQPPCTCLAGDLGCVGQPGDVCDPGGACVPPACLGVTCPAGEHCDPLTGTCIGLCVGVMCPIGQECRDGVGCVSRCEGVTCDPGLECDALTGECVDPNAVPDAGPMPPDAGAGGDAGGGEDASSGGGDGGHDYQLASGCNCRVGSRGGGLGGGLLLALAALALVRRRRR